MSALDSLLGHLDPATLGRMGAQLGLSPEQTQKAVQSSLPLILGAMQRNVQQPGGAEALHRAVVRDHQQADLGGLLGSLLGGQGGGQGSGTSGGGMGALLGAVMGAMGGGAAQQRSPMAEGGAILGHVFGSAQPRAAAGVAKAAGVDPGIAGQVMAMLAPMVMGALGQNTRQQGLDAGGLAAMLGQDTQRMAGGAAGGLQQMLGGVLDTDGDGDVDASDLARHASSLFGSFMRPR